VRLAAYLTMTALLSLLALVRVGHWALAEPVVALPVPPATTTSTTSIAAPAFLDGPVTYLRRPTTTTTPLPPRPWTWDQLAACESRNRWGVVRGVYQGGLQFDARTWDHYAPAYGFPADAHRASRAQQITIAERVLADQGAKAWPTCGPRIGMAGVATGSGLPPAGPPADEPD
jgi:hypothetical protein